MHAAMQKQGEEIHRESTEPMDANSGEPWSEADISDLKNELAHGRTVAETASFLCRDEDGGAAEGEGAGVARPATSQIKSPAKAGPKAPRGLRTDRA